MEVRSVAIRPRRIERSGAVRGKSAPRPQAGRAGRRAESARLAAFCGIRCSVAPGIRRLVVAAIRSITEIFGRPDDLKFRTRVTLLAAAALNEVVFSTALNVRCVGRADPSTPKRLSLLGR
jgi:hypothetical protein